MKFPPYYAYRTAAVAICLGLPGLWAWRVSLVRTHRALEGELRAAQARGARLAAQQQDAAAAGVRFGLLKRLDAQLAADRKGEKWAPLLKVLVLSHGAETQLTRIDARSKPGAPEACEIHVSGTAAGQPARAAADQYRRSLFTGLESVSRRGSVAVDFASLEDLPEAAGPQPRCAFTLIATFIPALGEARALPARDLSSS
jgi:hypothetical protein